VKRARLAKVRYPISSADQLIALLGERKSEAGGGHVIYAENITTFIPSEFFPIRHEGELVSRAYLALMRAPHPASIAAATQLVSAKPESFIVCPPEI
jgi:hypothetical protein